MLHPYQEKVIEGITNKRALAMVVDDICRFAITQNIPLCLPGSVGQDFFQPFDYSKIVYFPDSSS